MSIRVIDFVRKLYDKYKILDSNNQGHGLGESS